MINRVVSHRFAPLLAFLLIAAVGAIILQRQFNHINANAGKIAYVQHQELYVQRQEFDAIAGACRRLNIVRVNDNISHQADYQFFALTIKLLQASQAHHQPGQASPTKQQARTTRQFIGQLRRSANAKTWIPLTNCKIAVNHPLTFKIPQAVPFHVHKAPESALRIATANQ